MKNKIKNLPQYKCVIMLHENERNCVEDWKILEDGNCLLFFMYKFHLKKVEETLWFIF